MSATSGSFRRGIRIGIDVGAVRVGVARTDPDAVLAVPVTTITRPRAGAGRRTDLDALADLVVEYEPLEVVVGLPLTLGGESGPAVEAVQAYVADLAAVLADRGLSTPMRLVDERLTTAAAAKGLRSAGRDARSGRSVIDQAAAVIIVQDAVDAERRTGTPPGQVVRHDRDHNTDDDR
jgi:putative pre-16S rRNA nuclease